MSTHSNKSTSWFARLGSALRGKQRSGSSGQNRRRLGFESLETRRLLSATVLPSIAGTVYQNTGATSAAETPLANITVNLWRDGGDGVFEGDSPGSDDTLVGTATTTAKGTYQFNNLSAGNYFVQQDAVPGLVAASGQNVQEVNVTSASMQGTTGTMIDSFSTTSQYVQASLHGGKTDTSSESASEAIGGHRNLYVQLTSTGGAVDMGADSDWQGVLDFGADAASNGVFWVNWDGDNSNAAVLDPTGLGQTDLTSQGAATGIELNVGADHDNGFVMLKVFSDASDWSWTSVPITNTTDGSLTSADSQYVPFSTFQTGGGTGADFAQVGAVQLSITGGMNAIDGEVGPIETVGPTVFTENFVNSAEADLAVVKTASPSPAVAGSQLTYTFTTTNNGPSNATGVTLSDTLPAGVQYVSSTSSQGAVTDNNGTISVQLGSMASGAVATTSVVVTVDPSDTGSLTNTVTVTGDQPDPNLANNTSTVTTPLSPSADLALTKTASPSEVKAGQELTYTLTATNNGPSNATGVTIVDPLPANTTYVSSSGQSTATISGQTLTLDVGDLSTGASAVTTVVVDVASTASGIITNTATVSGNQPDPNLANNTATVSTTVAAAVLPQGTGLSIVKTASPNPVICGTCLTYTLAVTNDTQATETGVTVVDALPAGFRYFWATGDTSATLSGSTLTLDLGNLAAEATDTITVVGVVTATSAGTLTNTATATDSEGDSATDSVATNVILPVQGSKYYLLGK